VWDRRTDDPKAAPWLARPNGDSGGDSFERVAKIHEGVERIESRDPSISTFSKSL